MEAIHEHREALVKLAPPGLGLIDPEVDARIEIEQEAAQPCLPARPVVALEEVAQRVLSGSKLHAGGSRYRASRSRYRKVLTDPGAPKYGQNSHK